MGIFTKPDIIFENAYDLSVITPDEVVYGEDIVALEMSIFESMHKLDITLANNQPVMEGVGDVLEKLMDMLRRLKEKIVQFFNGLINYFTSTKAATEEYIKTVRTMEGRGDKVEIWKKPEVAESLDRFTKASEFMDIMMPETGIDMSAQELEADIAKMEALKPIVKQKIMKLILGKDVMEDDFKKELMNKLLGEEMEEKYFSSPKAIAPLLQDATNLMEKGKAYKTTTANLNDIGLKLMESELRSLERLPNSETKSLIVKRARLRVNITQTIFSFFIRVMTIWKDAVTKYIKSLKVAVSTLSKGKLKENNNPQPA